MKVRSLAPLLPLLLLCSLSAGCRSRPSVKTEEDKAPAPSASANPIPQPLPSAEIQQALNPGNEKPYSGPIGGVKGTVHVSGDPAPELPEVLAKIPAAKCPEARAFYGKLFREGPNRELGDVLVAVTEYKGYLPAPDAPKVVVARGCAFESRTISMVFGQRLEVLNKGGTTFIPRLVGARQSALLVAMPGGDTVKLFPDHVGQFELADQTHDFARADVFVLKFPTSAVTGLDGKFEMKDIPAGDVVVSAYLPALKKTATQKVSVVAGETATVDFTIPYEAPK